MGIKKGLLKTYDLPGPLKEIVTILLGFLLIISALYEGWSNNNERDEYVDNCSCKKNGRKFYITSLTVIIVLWFTAVLYTYGVDYCCKVLRYLLYVYN